MIKTAFYSMLLWFVSFPLTAEGFDNELMAKGKQIYELGLLTSNKEIHAKSAEGIDVNGQQAACVNCHRKSGMGSVEGNIQVQPIAAPFLFQNKALATMDLKVGKQFNQSHTPYNAQSLFNTLKTGINSSGRQLNKLMPRYDFSENDFLALKYYLENLSSYWSPGAGNEKIQFATVIAPGVDLDRRQLFLETLQQSFAQKNASTVASSNVGRRRHMVSAAEMVLGTERSWQLHVWQLQGEPETWAQQLRDFNAKQPVFAIVSGLSDTTWSPVTQFCQDEHIPCWFPVAPFLEETAGDYDLNYSQGTGLEAKVLAKHLKEHFGNKAYKVIQFFKNDYVGINTANTLTKFLNLNNIKSDNVMVGDHSKHDIENRLRKLGKNDVAVFWFNADDIKHYIGNTKIPRNTVYFSSEMLGISLQGVTDSIKNNAKFIYLYELDEQRKLNLQKFNIWLAQRKLTIKNEALQAKVFFAVDFMSETLSEMLDNLYRDYLIERAQNMLSKRETASSEQWARDRALVGKKDIAMGHGTSLFPHLSLASGQNFASKGAYIVSYNKNKLVANTGWIVP